MLEGGDDDLRRDRGGEGDPLQQSRAAHAGDPRIAPGELEDPGLQLRAEGAGLLEQAVLGEGAEHGEGHGRAQGVAAEGGAVLAGAQQAGGVLAEGEHGTDREAAAETLGQRHHVGLQPPDRLVGEPLPRPSDAGLDLVEDQQGAVAGGELAGRAEVLLRQRQHSGLALDRLEHERGDVPRGEGRLECGHVAGGQKLDPAGQRLEGGAVGLLVGEGERAHGAAVEALLEREDPGPAGAAGDLEGGLVGLGAGVREEHARALGRLRQLQQALGELDLGGGGEEVRDVHEGARLLRHRGDHVGVGVAEGVDGDPA